MLLPCFVRRQAESKSADTAEVPRACGLPSSDGECSEVLTSSRPSFTIAIRLARCTMAPRTLSACLQQNCNECGRMPLPSFANHCAEGRMHETVTPPPRATPLLQWAPQRARIGILPLAARRRTLLLGSACCSTLHRAFRVLLYRYPIGGSVSGAPLSPMPTARRGSCRTL